jgi:hypothetical protein
MEKFILMINQTENYHDGGNQLHIQSIILKKSDEKYFYFIRARML